jgi:hypothetical protein
VPAVEIWWPASGLRQTVSGLELDASYEVTEGIDAARRLQPRRFRLGAQSR